MGAKFKLSLFLSVADASRAGDKYETSSTNHGYSKHMKLKIRSVGPGDFGSYRCVAKNSLGETDGLIKLDGKKSKWRYEFYLLKPGSTECLSVEFDKKRTIINTTTDFNNQSFENTRKDPNLYPCSCSIIFNKLYISKCSNIIE